MGRPKLFSDPRHLRTRIEARTKRLMDALAGDPRVKTRWGQPVSYGRIISVLVDDEATRLGIGVEGALLSDEQLGESRER